MDVNNANSIEVNGSEWLKQRWSVMVNDGRLMVGEWLVDDWLKVESLRLISDAGCC